MTDREYIQRLRDMFVEWRGAIKSTTQDRGSVSLTQVRGFISSADQQLMTPDSDQALIAAQAEIARLRHKKVRAAGRAEAQITRRLVTALDIEAPDFAAGRGS